MKKNYGMVNFGKCSISPFAHKSMYGKHIIGRKSNTIQLIILIRKESQMQALTAPQKIDFEWDQ